MTAETVEVLKRLRNASTLAFQNARVVGAWVWVEFDSIPATETRDTLKSLGFHWNKNRQAWQHPCGRHSGPTNGNPKWKYGVVNAQDLETAIA